MQRTQISLELEQHRRLTQEARRAGISMSALIRRLVEAHFRERPAPEAEDPLETIVGIGRGTGESVGRAHDRYLYGKDVP